MDNTEKTKYQKLAYVVIRDAIGFLFGIEEFFKSIEDLDTVKQELTDQRLTRHPNRDPEKVRRSVSLQVDRRIAELKLDLKNSKEILSEPNLWLDVLDLDADVFYKYLLNLNDTDKASLAVVPKWNRSDDTLGRPYLSDTYETHNERGNIFSPYQ